MKNRIIFVIINFVFCAQLIAQKAQIDPYLRAANLAYGNSQSSVNGRTMKAQNAIALRQSLRAVGIDSNNNREEFRVNVLLEFEGNINELEKLEVNLKTKVGSISSVATSVWLGYKPKKH